MGRRNGIVIDIVTYRSIARQRLGKHIPAEANVRNNRTSIIRQWISKGASLTIEAVSSGWSMQSGYKEALSWGESVAARSSQGATEDEFIWVRCFRGLGPVLELAAGGDSEEMARKELDCDKKTSFVIWSDSESVINPLPGYD
jgi:hypothetical protein